MTTIPGQLYTSSGNAELISEFSNSVGIQKVVLKYLDSLRPDELKDKLSLLLSFNNVLTAKKIADRYIETLSQDELYTSDNLIFLANFTKNIDEFGFNLFYNTPTASKVEAIIRRKPNYEKTFAIEFANYIFYSGHLYQHYIAALNGEMVDWDKIEAQFKGRLSDEFIHSNVLKTRVQALEVLTKTSGLY